MYETETVDEVHAARHVKHELELAAGRQPPALLQKGEQRSANAVLGDDADARRLCRGADELYDVRMADSAQASKLTREILERIVRRPQNLHGHDLTSERAPVDLPVRASSDKLVQR